MSIWMVTNTVNAHKETVAFLLLRRVTQAVLCLAPWRTPIINDSTRKDAVVLMALPYRMYKQWTSQLLYEFKIGYVENLARTLCIRNHNSCLDRDMMTGR